MRPACSVLWSLLLVILGLGAGAGEVLDRQRIFDELAGKPKQAGVSRSIAVEEVETAWAVPPAYTTASLPAVQFEHDSARLTIDAVEQLRELSAALKMEPLNGYRFAIQGHTDGVGGAPYNRALSIRRAESVKRHLVGSREISATRLTAVGVGEELPLPGVAPDDPRNRRVEVIVLGRWEWSARPADANSAAGTQRALLVGIDSYPNVSDLLGAPVNDVEAVRGFIVDRLGFPPAGIRTLVNDDATREGVLDGLRWALAGAGRALVYFSGHGFRQRDEDGDEADGWDETLVPVDVVVENGLAKGMITDDEIGALLARWSGAALDIVIDACHSGTLTRSVGADWRLVKSPRLPDGSPLEKSTRSLRPLAVRDAEPFVETTDPTVAVWTAVRADQKALVDVATAPRYGSVFTDRLLAGAEGVADADGNGTVTVRELNRHVRRESSAYCKQHPGICGAGLTPELSISSAGLDKPAFAGETSRLPRVASLAKDILVSPKEYLAGGEAVRLELDPGTELRLGDEIEISVESDTAGALVLLDIDAHGRVTQVFPNELSLAAGMSRTVLKGAQVRIPGVGGGFRLRAQPPLGRGLVVAVVAEDGTGLSALTARHKDLAVVSRPEAYVVELAGQLRRYGSGRWSYGQLAYEVTGEE